MTKEYGGPDGTPEGSEIRRDVVDGGDESLVYDMGDCYEKATREGHGQEEAHHGRSLVETPPDQPTPTLEERKYRLRVRIGEANQAELPTSSLQVPRGQVFPNVRHL